MTNRTALSKTFFRCHPYRNHMAPKSGTLSSPEGLPSMRIASEDSPSGHKHRPAVRREILGAIMPQGGPDGGRTIGLLCHPAKDALFRAVLPPTLLFRAPHPACKGHSGAP